MSKTYCSPALVSAVVTLSSVTSSTTSLLLLTLTLTLTLALALTLTLRILATTSSCFATIMFNHFIYNV